MEKQSPPVVTTLPLEKKQRFEFDKSYTFRLRRHKSGPFSGLWELTKLNKVGGIEKMMKDADALNFCMDDVMGELEEEGF